MATTTKERADSLVVINPTRATIESAMFEAASRAGLGDAEAGRLVHRHSKTVWPGIAKYGIGTCERISYVYVTGPDGVEAWRFFPAPGRDAIVPLLASAIAAP